MATREMPGTQVQDGSLRNLNKDKIFIAEISS
jgi:hypothetical protein